MPSRILSFSLNLAFWLLYVYTIWENTLIAYENPDAPVSIINIQKIRSPKFVAEMSPYPIVVIVVIQKYIATRYNSWSGKSAKFPLSTQVPVPF